jgi:chemotaxis signal transduction protein
VDNLSSTFIDSIKGILVFKIAGLELCIDIEYVSSIITPQDKYLLTTSNNLGDEKIKVNEEMMPILNFHSMFGLKTPPEDDNTRYVLLDFMKRKFVFMVDNIQEIISINKKTRDALKYVPIDDKPYLDGKLIFDGQIILYPDLEKIIRDQKSYSIISDGSWIDSKNEEELF